jgi:hypothetical protein
MRRRVIWYKFTDVSGEYVVSIFNTMPSGSSQIIFFSYMKGNAALRNYPLHPEGAGGGAGVPGHFVNGPRQCCVAPGNVCNEASVNAFPDKAETQLLSNFLNLPAVFI